MDLREFLKKIKTSKLFFAFVINMIVLLIMVLFFYAKYDCELDIVMQTLLYGVGSGGWYSSHLMFSNIFLGGILSVLMRILPMVAWYTVFHYTMAFVAMVILTYIVVTYNNSLTGRTVATIVSIFLGYECYIMPMYMKTAALLAAVGVLLLGYVMFRKEEQTSIQSRKQNRFCLFQIVLAGILGVVGSWVSYQVFLAVFFISLAGVLILGFWNKKFARNRLLVGNAIVIILTLSVLSHGLDEYLYADNALWSEAGKYRNAIEQLYAFGFPDYEDIEVTIKTNGYSDIDASTYETIQSGIYSDGRDNFSLLQVIAEQRMEHRTGEVLQLFHLMPIRAFKTGMFYLWMILVVVLLYKACCVRTIGKVAISLIMVGIPYFVQYFRYGYEVQCLGMIAYLPAIVFLILNLKEVSLQGEQYLWVYLGLLGVVLYYIFSGSMLNGVQKNDELEDIVALQEYSERAQLVDFNYYIQGFSIYKVYPKNLDTGNTFIVNGIYALTPGFRTTQKLFDGRYGKWGGYEVYGRYDMTTKIIAQNVSTKLKLNESDFVYAETFHRLAHRIHW